jgi:hypothetical protein
MPIVPVRLDHVPAAEPGSERTDRQEWLLLDRQPLACLRHFLSI